jgi:3-isopropylmalate/(R)-2-methylmalate dehydratase small subunit
MADHTRHIIRGKVFVVGDNIDTDQIIPAKYLSLVPTIPEEYEKLGSYAMIGWPGEPRYVLEGRTKTDYPIIIGGRNFGCGSSREHAPIALGAAGCEVVVARSFARIFFRNCIATGELYPVETDVPDLGLTTGDEVEIDLDVPEMRLADGRKVSLKSLGDALPVIDAGGIFAFSRESGLLK